MLEDRINMNGCPLVGMHPVSLMAYFHYNDSDLDTDRLLFSSVLVTRKECQYISLLR